MFKVKSSKTDSHQNFVRIFCASGTCAKSSPAGGLRICPSLYKLLKVLLGAIDGLEGTLLGRLPTFLLLGATLAAILAHNIGDVAAKVVANVLFLMGHLGGW